MLSLVAVLALGACTPAAPEAPVETEAVETSDQAVPTNTIVDVALANPDFSTLVEALQVAGLVDVLAAEGPYTVFAPTNEAFAALEEGVLEDLLANPEALAEVLTYHVVEGMVTSDQVVTLESAPTLQGSDLTIAVEGEQVMINDATVVTADVMAQNGVIHVIDTVLVP